MFSHQKICIPNGHLIALMFVPQDAYRLPRESVNTQSDSRDALEKCLNSQTDGLHSRTDVTVVSHQNV